MTDFHQARLPCRHEEALSFWTAKVSCAYYLDPLVLRGGRRVSRIWVICSGEAFRSDGARGAKVRSPRWSHDKRKRGRKRYHVSLQDMHLSSQCGDTGSPSPVLRYGFGVGHVPAHFRRCSSSSATRSNVEVGLTHDTSTLVWSLLRRFRSPLAFASSFKFFSLVQVRASLLLFPTPSQDLSPLPVKLPLGSPRHRTFPRQVPWSTAPEQIRHHRTTAEVVQKKRGAQFRNTRQRETQ